MKTALSAKALLFSVGLFLLPCIAGIATAQSSNNCVSPLGDDTLTIYELIAEVSYVETNSSGPVLNGSNAFMFAAVIKLATNLSGTASSAELTFPDGQPSVMNPLGQDEFYIEAATNSFTNVVSIFPAGTYQFTILGNTISATLPADTALPNAPALVNYAAAQSIDVTKDFTLSWNPFTAGGSGDVISVTLTAISGIGVSFKSQPYGCPGALDGAATSILVPANTLTSNTTYRAQIEFIKAYTINADSARAILVGAETATIATMVTGPISAPPQPPVLSNAALLPGGNFRFDFSTAPGSDYTIQFNQTLANPAGWTPLLTTNAPANLVSFTNTPTPGGTGGYYRVVQP